MCEHYPFVSDFMGKKSIFILYISCMYQGITPLKLWGLENLEVVYFPGAELFLKFLREYPLGWLHLRGGT